MKEYKGPVIVIVGPTGSGKTGLSIEIAKELTGERSASLADALLTRRTSSTSRSATPASLNFISARTHVIMNISLGGDIIFLNNYVKGISWRLSRGIAHKILPTL